MNLAHKLPVRVYWEDTDASGVVYHANYLKWAERGRSDWLRAQGGAQQQWLEQAEIAFTIAELTVRYRRPARLDDDVVVLTQVTAIKKASLQFDQQILMSAGDELLARLSVKAGCVDLKSFRPRPLPAWFLSQNSV